MQDNTEQQERTWEEWHREPTLTHELGFLVMEGNRPIAICPSSERADAIVRDHTDAKARRDAEDALRRFVREFDNMSGPDAAFDVAWAHAVEARQILATHESASKEG